MTNSNFLLTQLLRLKLKEKDVNEKNETNTRVNSRSWL
jgi:hypothetical protein